LLAFLHYTHKPQTLNEVLLAKAGASATRSVRIGQQEWMAANLSVPVFRNGDPIAVINDLDTWSQTREPAMCCYSGDTGLSGLYGCLYNWYAVTDPRGLAPEGWRVPADQDWNALIDAVGGDRYAGSVLKMTKTPLWKSPNYNAHDMVGFGALAGGYRDMYGVYHFLRSYGYYWSSTLCRKNFAWCRRFGYSEAIVQRLASVVGSAMSVRCVRDISQGRPLEFLDIGEGI